MATSAFKSTTKRSSIGTTAGDSGSSNRTTAHRRSRSLSRPPVRYPVEDENQQQQEVLPLPRAKFVNTVRGSGFPEIISLDDLANEFFSPDERGESQRSSRSTRRSSTTSGATTASSQRRGRSVSRSRASAPDGGAKGASVVVDNTKAVLDGNLRKRRSLSVARYQFSDSSESDDIDQSHKCSSHAYAKGSDRWNYQDPSLHKPVTANQQHILRRSLSQKDFSKSRDGYSSQSSALTDEDARETHSNKNGIERTIQAVYAQNKTEHPSVDGGETELYEVMRKELRHAVEEIRTELEHGIVKMNHPLLANDDCLQSNKSDVLLAVAVIRDNYAAKLEQSEKRKQDLLSEIVVEEQRGRQLSKLVKELLPDQKNTAPQENLSRGRKKSDRSWMSKCLTEDAEKYFDDFISNVEDTDISSFDGERSDASSTMGVKKQRDPVLQFGETEPCATPLRSTASVEMDGVVLPWLQWETSNDGSPIPCKSKAETSLTSHNKLRDSSQDESTAQVGSNFVASSRGSWNPGGDSPSVFSKDNIENIFGVRGSCLRPKDSHFDMDEYLHIQQTEEILFEIWRQRRKISSGALILCNRTCLLL